MDLRIEHIAKGSPAVAPARALYEAAFPAHERIPFWFLLRRTKLSSVEFLAYYDEGVFVGTSYVITHNDFSLVLYLAIDSTHRSKGYGSAVLHKLDSHYQDKRIALEIETLDPKAANYEQRVRRKSFYEKNGYKDSGLLIDDKDEVYEVLVRNGNVSEADYQGLYRQFAGPFLFKRFMPKVVHADK